MQLDGYVYEETPGWGYEIETSVTYSDNWNETSTTEYTMVLFKVDKNTGTRKLKRVHDEIITQADAE